MLKTKYIFIVAFGHRFFKPNMLILLILFGLKSHLTYFYSG